MSLRGLYAITPDARESAALIERARAALTAATPSPVRMLQYRNKLADPASRRREAAALAALCRAQRTLFVVNDDLELALQVGADGVHLGRDDGDLAGARARLGDRLLGASCYNELERARTARAAGADLVAFGSVFGSATKPGAVRAPLAVLGQARSLGIPVVAIGGITLHNAAEAIRAGADLVAVISDLFDAPDVAARARAYARLFEKESP
ncbi:MAG: thiamine phosphate synthase [Betaproteobacteria bacterium]|nr:thiamine phosphate synthase [Betaproteobacteria bacterium]